MGYKLIIAGGRDFTGYQLAQESLKELLSTYDISEIVSGGARGADRIGEMLGQAWGIETSIFKAEWDKYGKAAGYRRNKQMAEYADGLLAFWDGKSRGTGHMIDLAMDLGLDVKVVNYGKE